jgi:hypothetical protein
MFFDSHRIKAGGPLPISSTYQAEDAYYSPYLSFLPVTLSSSQNRVQVVSKKKIGSATALAGAVEAQSND